MTSFRHSGNLGDIWAALPAMKEYHRKTKKDIVLYLWLNRPAYYFNNAVHPVRDSAGTQVMLNNYMFEMAKPLLLAQPFISEVKEWNGEHIEVNLDLIRDANINMPYSDLRRWYFYVFPDLSCDVSTPYIEAPRGDENPKIIVNRTQRYLNPLISYHFLKEYGNDVAFVGTNEEHAIFCKDFDLDIKRLLVPDFLSLATAINSCKVFIGNQSQAFQIAEGLKSPRVVEVCSFAPNVIPAGPNGYDFYSQVALEYYVKSLYEKM